MSRLDRSAVRTLVTALLLLLAPAHAIRAQSPAPTSAKGVDTAGMDLETYLQHGLGPAGSELRLEGVGADGEPFDVTVRRALIARPDD